MLISEETERRYLTIRPPIVPLAYDTNKESVKAFLCSHNLINNTLHVAYLMLFTFSKLPFEGVFWFSDVY